MKRERRVFAHPGFLVLLCAVGLFLFYWPFLLYPREWRQPHTAIYLFVAWVVVIALISLVSRAVRPSSEREEPWPTRRSDQGE